jgi:16S rRNA C967 or C1407 C5-methylase (RsmB/RsmF family)
MQLVENAELDEKDQLPKINMFPTESFDRILLDPPCSALGLRPKLFIDVSSLRQLQKHAEYQRNFVKEAVALLKPGGYLTYSTCTINAEENEAMVHHILTDYPSMSLVPIPVDMGQAGLPGFGLNDDERGKVRRFDPHNEEDDAIGFFVALFQRKDAG